MSERNEDNHSAETSKRPRRNQPRHPVTKESTTAADVTTSAEDLLKEACEPLTEGEIQQWPGWIELESEPTTSNACATVALLNILMNAPDINLGPQLSAFKEATQTLDTHLRGHSIMSNSFIRSTHNAFTRRIDQLNADLSLENDTQDAAQSKARRGAKRKKRAAVVYGFHFIAYVPCDGHVWELDGLQGSPLKLDSIQEDCDWTAIARPCIEARMLQYESSQLSFNLLALCSSSLLQTSQSIASTAAALSAIKSHMKDSAVFQEAVSAEEHEGSHPLLDIHDPTALAEFNLTSSDVEAAELPGELVHSLSASSAQWQVQDAFDTYCLYRTRLKTLVDEYRMQLMESEEVERCVKSRKRDYGGVLHCWVKKLAERGVLEDVIRMSS
ncbi:ubiquitin carboxyl-terminal hydrolase [Moelleriella libera RCEF 2490]|uniref:ubiquitinyl hydrolase 1 n=1 Tax=Moelleriella libera RCEF 2490 TaxID=1081109 RepID=A0A167WKW1_9HYPO|nr:ubiquitin carboxyl-terminal hydrolase [Moelleriella libera RCEF 2490]